MSSPPQYGNLGALLRATKQRRYVHLTLHFDTPLANFVFEKIKSSINTMSGDWLKYGRDSWILYTSETPDGVYRKLLADVPELKPHSIMTFYFDLDGARSGQQERWVWDWFSRKR